MNQKEFRQTVKTLIDIDENDRADEIIEAVLKTLSMRLSKDEASHLAAQLPEPYKTEVDSMGGVETFDLDEYLERVTGKLQVDRLVATRYAQAVLNVLSDAVTRGEIKDVRSQLPEEYNVLFSPLSLA